MVTIDKARIVRYSKNSNIFEIYVDADLVFDYKENKRKFEDIYSSLLAIEEVYKDAMSGEKAPRDVLESAFGTQDIYKISKEIIDNGRLDLTTEQKRKMAEVKRKEIIQYIVVNSINPQTNAPHTSQRVELAMEKVRLDIDVQKSVSSQIDKIIEKLKIHLPMKFQVVTYKVTIPVGLAGKVNGILNKYNVISRNWAQNFECIVEVPIGIKDRFLSNVYGLTNNNAKVEIQ